MLTPQQISRLKELGLTRKKIADFERVSERTVYRWNKQNKVYDYWHQRHRRKWGRNQKLTGETLKTFLDYISKNNTLTQQEMADYASQLVGQPITRYYKRKPEKNSMKVVSEGDKEKWDLFFKV